MSPTPEQEFIPDIDAGTWEARHNALTKQLAARTKQLLVENWGDEGLAVYQAFVAGVPSHTYLRYINNPQDLALEITGQLKKLIEDDPIFQMLMEHVKI